MIRHRLTPCRYIKDNSHVAGVGYSGTSDTTYHAFLRDESSSMKNFDTLGGASKQVWGINNKGQIVGYSETESGETHAMLWDPISNSDTTHKTRNNQGRPF